MDCFSAVRASRGNPYFTSLVDVSQRELPYLVGAAKLMDGQLRRAGGSRLDSEFLYPVTKRVGMKVQDLRCPLHTLDFAAGLVKSRREYGFAQPRSRSGSAVCRFVQRCRRLWGLCAPWFSAAFAPVTGIKVPVQPQDRFRRNNHRTLNHILQLPDVARPWIVQKVLHRFPRNAFDLLPQPLR